MSDTIPTAFGLPMASDLPKTWIPLEAVVVLECLDETGAKQLYVATTESLNPWTMVGMLTGVLDDARIELGSAFEVEVPDDDE